MYAHDLGTSWLRIVTESGWSVPGGGTFVDFAVEPKAGIFHSSIAVNEAGDVVLVAKYRHDGKTLQGVFLLENFHNDSYTPALILSSGAPESDELLGDGVEIQSFNTVAINERSEIAFVVANTDEVPIRQGLVFYRNATDGLRSVFKPGDPFLAELEHPGQITSAYGGMVSGSQALDSSLPPRLFFRHFYKVREGSEEVGHSMMVLATLK